MRKFIEFLIDHVAARIAGAAVAYAAGKGVIPAGLAASGDVHNWGQKIGLLYAGLVPTYVSSDERHWIEDSKAVCDAALDYLDQQYQVNLYVDAARRGVLIQAVLTALAARYPAAP